MSQAPKETPYVYQPFGIQNKEHWAESRIYAVAAGNRLTRIEGLTKTEAEAVCTAMKEGEFVYTSKPNEYATALDALDESRLSALQQSHERLLKALQEVLDDEYADHSRCSPSICPHLKARAAIAEATPEGESREPQG